MVAVFLHKLSIMPDTHTIHYFHNFDVLHNVGIVARKSGFCHGYTCDPSVYGRFDVNCQWRFTHMFTVSSKRVDGKNGNSISSMRPCGCSQYSNKYSLKEAFEIGSFLPDL